MEKKILKILVFVALYSVIALMFLGFYEFSDFASSQHELSLNFTEQVHAPLRVSAFMKREYFFNYSEKELSILNKYQTAKKCSFGSSDQILLSNNKFVAVCQNKKLPTFLFGNEKTSFSLYSDPKIRLKWDSLQHKNKSSEFVYIKCSQNRIYPFVTNQFNKDHENSANEIRNQINEKSKNLNILVLSFESLSRNAAFRHLPKFFSLFQGSEYDFYNFSDYSKSSSRFTENYFKTVYGNSFKEFSGNEKDFRIKNEIGFKDKKKIEYCIKKFEKIAIWNIFNKLGFVTMYSNDNLNLFHAEDGNDYLANHVFVNFWKADQAIFDETHLHPKSKYKQKCFGNRTNYDISFDYTRQFFENYKKSNKFSLVHISHSKASNFNYQDFDNSLYGFFKELMNGKHPNLLVFFISHQGEQFDEFTIDPRGFYESVNPFFFLIADNNLISDLRSEHVLRHNSDKLLTGSDIYKTLKDLANYPFNDVHALKIHPYTKNLFIEKIDRERTCRNAGAHAESCLNNDFWLLELKNNQETKIVNELILMIKQLSQTLSSNNKNCKELGKVRVDLAEKLNLISKDTDKSSLYRIKLYDNWHKNFTIIGFFTSNTKINLSSSTIYKEFQSGNIGIQAVEGLNSCISPQ